jgi:GntR family transcriptional regulator
MITIDLNSQVALFSQLMTQLKQAIENKLLQPGDALPSIRQLAADLDINAKTVAKAYSLLERDSVIESRGSRGSFVREDALLHIDTDINAWLLEVLTQDISKYRAAGVTDPEIRIAFQQILSKSPSPQTPNTNNEIEE